MIGRIQTKNFTGVQTVFQWVTKTYSYIDKDLFHKEERMKENQ